MNILLGLGNPGKKYDKTPHNVGYYLVDSLARSFFWRTGKKALTQKSSVNGRALLLAKPLTYMNLSGEAAHHLLSYYKISLENLVVVVDDANLNLGAIRIRTKGSDGGHKGLKSIIHYLGPEFTRMRIGVGICPPEWDLTNFVLKKFSKHEQAVMKEIRDNFTSIIEYGLKNGWEKAGARFNRSAAVELNP